jgi:transcription elongation factor
MALPKKRTQDELLNLNPWDEEEEENINEVQAPAATVVPAPVSSAPRAPTAGKFSSGNTGSMGSRWTSTPPTNPALNTQVEDVGTGQYNYQSNIHVH